MRTKLAFVVAHDPGVAPDAIADAFDVLLDTAFSTPNVLDDLGNPEVVSSVTVIEEQCER